VLDALHEGTRRAIDVTRETLAAVKRDLHRDAFTPATPSRDVPAPVLGRGAVIPDRLTRQGSIGQSMEPTFTPAPGGTKEN